MKNICTSRCIITELNLYDIDDAVELFVNDDVRSYLGGAIGEKLALEKLYTWLNKTHELYLTVRILKSGEFVGIISITDHHDGVFKELSYQFLPEFWNKGIATETIEAILEYVKVNSEIEVLVAETQSKNYASCKLLEKLGFSLTDTVSRFGEKQNIYKKIL